MQPGRTAWEQMSPSSMQFCAPGAGPTWWQVRLSWLPCSQETDCRNTWQFLTAEAFHFLERAPSGDLQDFISMFPACAGIWF